MQLLRTFITFLCFVLFSFINFLVFLIDPSRRLLTKLLHFEGKLGSFILGLKMQLIRDDFSPFIKKNKNYLFVSNHQSMLDIALIYRFCPVPLSFIAKRELFFVPFLNLMLLSTGAIPINRNNIKKAWFDIKHALNVLKKSRSILIFPEGTRTTDGKIHQFKSGFLRLAKDADVEIVPIKIEGTFSALKKGSFVVKNSSLLKISFGAPLSVNKLSDKNPAEEIKNIVSSL